MSGRAPTAAVVAALVTVLAVVVGCAAARPDAIPSRAGAPTSDSRTPSGAASPTPSPAPSPPPAPEAGSCHRLGLQAAGAPTDGRPAVPCSSGHTTVTFAVGHFDPVRDGHLLTVDSRSVQQQIADRCPRALPAYLGGTRAERRLSRFTVVWFSPTVAQAAAGATWFRCDVVALAGQGRLAPLPAQLRGVLDRPGALDRFGTCGTAAPDTRRFARVICSHRHTWRAVAVINLPPGSHLHAKAAGRSADARCKQVAADAAHGALKYTWSFEWPTRAQWRAGQRYGMCWLPSS